MSAATEGAIEQIEIKKFGEKIRKLPSRNLMLIAIFSVHNCSRLLPQKRINHCRY